MIGASVVVMVREVRGGRAAERARWLRLAGAEAEVNTAAFDHRHVADGKQRPQHERGQQHQREERRAPPRRQPEG